MTVQGQLKETDYVTAQFLHVRPRPFFTFIGLILLGLAVLALIYTRSLPLLVSLICLIGIFVFYMPYKARRIFRQYKALSEPVTMEVREEGLFFKRTNAEGLVPWSHIIKWRNNNKLALLYPAGNVFHMIPSHFFVNSEEFQTFLKTLRVKLGKTS